VAAPGGKDKVTEQIDKEQTGAEPIGNSGRLVLLSIIGLPLTMILAATWLWYFVVNGNLDLVEVLGTANNGTLVQPPRQLLDAAPREPGGRPLEWAGDRSRWILLVPLGGQDCGPACEHSLYLTRQIHIAMGKEFNRIGRYLVGSGGLPEAKLTVNQLSDQRPAPPDFATYLQAEHRRLTALQVEDAAHRELFSEYYAEPSTWYLVDPAGWVMMSYTDEVHYKDVIADLKFLLKNSGE
jgi:hypothetical protein